MYICVYVSRLSFSFFALPTIYTYTTNFVCVFPFYIVRSHFYSKYLSFYECECRREGCLGACCKCCVVGYAEYIHKM